MHRRAFLTLASAAAIAPALPMLPDAPLLTPPVKLMYPKVPELPPFRLCATGTGRVVIQNVRTGQFVGKRGMVSDIADACAVNGPEA